MITDDDAITKPAQRVEVFMGADRRRARLHEDKVRIVASYRQILVTAGPVRRRRYGLTVSRFGDDLDPVVECHTENEFWQLVVAIETTPASLCGLEQLEDHRERRPVGQASLRSDRAMAHGSEGALSFHQAA